MGYDTIFNGTFTNVSLKTFKIIQKLYNKHDDLFHQFDDITYDKKQKSLYLNSSWKNYDELITQMAIFLANLDKNIQGNIDCYGEDRDDIWNITIKNGKIRVFAGYIKYKEDTKDTIPLINALYGLKILKKLYEATSDEKYKKELIVKSLEQT